MTLRLSITGAIDRCETASNVGDDVMRWIGNLEVGWIVDGRPRVRSAAILRVTTGGAPNLQGWGRDRLALRWIGDMPDPDIAQSVYDWLSDRGPATGPIAGEIDSLPTSPGAASYQPVHRLVV